MLLSLGGEKPELLLHACCAPCTSSVLERLVPYFNVTLFFYNPNIRPREEYYKRAGELPKLLQALGLSRDVSIIIPDHDENEFLSSVSGMEAEPEGGARCPVCFRLRLQKTAEEARKLGIGFFATTLTVSPHKNAELINAVGSKISESSGVRWLPSDFKKRDGYLRSIRICQEFGIYRQNYCGCGFPDMV